MSKKGSPSDKPVVIIKSTNPAVQGGRTIPVPTNVLKPSTPDKSDKGDK